MKRISKVFVALVLIVGLERLIRTQTNGFRFDKIIAEFPYNPDWAVEIGAIPEVLNQPFYFLGSGAQTYSFIGEDRKTVLKFFKHYHCWPNSRTLRKLPWPWKEKVLQGRERRIESIFSSAALAYKALPEQTQVIHLHLNPGEGKLPPLVIYDKIGIRYQVDLNQTPFLLQKKGALLYPYLKKHPEEGKAMIDSFFAHIHNLAKAGISNSDKHLGRNVGVCEGKVIHLDIGSFFRCDSTELCDTAEFQRWLEKNRPDLMEYFNAQKHL